MCGIAGFTHKNWLPEPDRIESAAATLVHRGPDQCGVFRSSMCSLGATRLKIIDLEGGDQPITSADGDTTIVFNGEIYNHLEVRAELEKRGYSFKSHSDTETVLNAFLEWDTAAFSRLRGMFAIALWSNSRRRLVLARDRLGIKPLYVARLGEDLLFGSELKSIFVHPELDRRLSLAGLDCYLSLNYIPCPWTLIEGIEKLPPGTWLEWRDGKIATESYWQLPRGGYCTKDAADNGSGNHTETRTLDSACEELDTLLQESVREHLLSDVPLGLWLSGGVDSSTILHYATQASSSPLKTFSISFLGRSFDETDYIRRVARQYGTDHEELDLNPTADLTGAIQEFAYYSDEPTADAGALPVWFLSKLCKTKTTVALSGEGADELFGGYLTYRANALSAPMRRLPRWTLESALGVLRRWPVSDEKISTEYMAKRFLEGCLKTPEQAHVHWNGTFSQAEKQSLLRNRLPGVLDGLVSEMRQRSAAPDSLSDFLYFDQKYFLPDDILAKVDRMSMAHSVEVRPPFLDHRIVEFAAGLPASFKVRGSRQKVVLKKLMEHRLPPMILQRKKVGFDIPAHQWLRGPLRPLLEETLNEGLGEYGSLFRPGVVRNFLRLHLERRANIGYHLWGLLLLFLWLKKWRVQAAQAPAPAYSVPERTLIST